MIMGNGGSRPPTSAADMTPIGGVDTIVLLVSKKKIIIFMGILTQFKHSCFDKLNGWSHP